jgi:hypothetical protein
VRKVTKFIDENVTDLAQGDASPDLFFPKTENSVHKPFFWTPDPKEEENKRPCKTLQGLSNMMVITRF